MAATAARRVSALIVVIAGVAVASPPGTWAVKPDSDGRSVETRGTATVGDLHVDAFLGLICNRTGAPAAWLDFTIADADKVAKRFDLTPFEGPDAPAQARALVTLELIGDTGAHALMAHQSGWFSAEHDGAFAFGVGGAPKESKALAALIKRMARNGTALRIRIAAFEKSHPPIIAELPLSGSREALVGLAKRCP